MPVSNSRPTDGLMRVNLGKEERVRSTITFDGLTGSGLETDDPIIFTVTGRVIVKRLTAFCTVDLVSAGGGTLSLGTAGDVDGFIAATTATDVDVNDWWTAAAPAVGSKSPLVVFTGGLVTSQGEKLVSENIIITIGTADITGGVIIFDCWYEAITDTGKLA